MHRLRSFQLVLLFALQSLGQTPPSVADTPQFTTDNQLQRPANYREWIWLSSGLGMAYGPNAASNASDNPPFDNVFVSPAAYRAFKQTGTWPDQTMFVLEIRASETGKSINKAGRSQSQQQAMEVEVKDERRFPGKWAFFNFPGDTATAKMIPTTAGCYTCHRENGAVDNTFVQFYPTLMPVARQKGTVRSNYSE